VQSRGHRLRFRIALTDVREHAEASHLSALLRAHFEGPRCHRAAEQRDELAPPHSITSSARASRVGGTSRPRAFAVLRLITSSYFVGTCTGRSAAFSPLRMRSTYPGGRRYWSIQLAPYGTRPPAAAKWRSAYTAGSLCRAARAIIRSR